MGVIGRLGPYTSAELDSLTKGLSGAAAAVAAGMVELAAEEAEGEARTWLAGDVLQSCSLFR